MKKGAYTDTKYVYRNGTWGVASEQENSLGSCITENENSVTIKGGSYYACENTQWKELSVLEADTYGWFAGEVGEVKKGTYTDTKYVYRDGKWSAANTVTSALGSCTTKNAGTVLETNSTYYICKSSSWTKATVLEYDTYGYTCSKDGAIVSGSVNVDKKFVCDDGVFRYASADEIALDLGCTSYTNGRIDTTFSNSSYIERWSCLNDWIFQRIGQSITDFRDGQIYKIVTIGSQTWMAENLNYNYNVGSAESYCYDNRRTNCDKYGRLYMWSAAMDSAGVFSDESEGCGKNKKCHSSGARGVCPEEWHLPSNKEWSTLLSAVGQRNRLKSVSGWDSNGSDDVAFAVLPAGFRQRYLADGSEDFHYMGSYASFWTSGEATDFSAYKINFGSKGNIDGYSEKQLGFSVRCIRNSD